MIKVALRLPLDLISIFRNSTLVFVFLEMKIFKFLNRIHRFDVVIYTATIDAIQIHEFDECVSLTGASLSHFLKSFMYFPSHDEVRPFFAAIIYEVFFDEYRVKIRPGARRTENICG